jgi:protein-S-isoprenylcysteine O-methyltransferase Ste14
VATLALVLLVIFAVLTFGVRVVVQLRRTGSTGLAGLSGDAGAVERLAGGLFVFATLLGAAPPLLVIADVLEPISSIDGDAVNAAGLVLVVAGGLGVFGAQMAMGDSWRIGVDEGERTELVSGGVFALCRNPIYTAMITAWIGFALMVPTWVSIAQVVLVVFALEIQVRAVEEPHMRRSHGETYADYARRVGRFVPGFGRL